jgi:hypothetical protein
LNLLKDRIDAPHSTEQPGLRRSKYLDCDLKLLYATCFIIENQIDKAVGTAQSLDR